MFSVKIQKLLEERADHRAKVDDAIQVLVNKGLDDSKAFQAAIVASDASSEYGADEHGVYRWFRVSMLSSLGTEIRPFVATYLQEHGIDVDWGSECFHRYCGPCILISDDEVFDEDSHATIATRNDWRTRDDEGDWHEDEEYLHYLIDEYMEKSGYFPDVLHVDRYATPIGQPIDVKPKADAYRERIKQQKEQDNG